MTCPICEIEKARVLELNPNRGDFCAGWYKYYCPKCNPEKFQPERLAKLLAPVA